MADGFVLPPRPAAAATEADRLAVAARFLWLCPGHTAALGTLGAWARGAGAGAGVGDPRAGVRNGACRAGPGKLRQLIGADSRFVASNARGGSAWEVTLSPEAAADEARAAAAESRGAAREASAGAACAAAATAAPAIFAAPGGTAALGDGSGSVHACGAGEADAAVLSVGAAAAAARRECAAGVRRWYERTRGHAESDGDAGSGGGGGAGCVGKRVGCSAAASPRACAGAADRFAVAPMMAITDRHFRTLLRLLTARARLYTEMVVDTSVLFAGDGGGRLLAFDAVQHPLALQVPPPPSARMHGDMHSRMPPPAPHVDMHSRMPPPLPPARTHPHVPTTIPSRDAAAASALTCRYGHA